MCTPEKGKVVRLLFLDLSEKQTIRRFTIAGRIHEPFPEIPVTVQGEPLQATHQLTSECQQWG